MEKRPIIKKVELKGIILDQANDKLKQIHKVSGWILDHWDKFPDDIYRKIQDIDGNDEFIPYDIREFLVDALNGELGDAATLTMNWRLWTKEE